MNNQHRKITGYRELNKTEIDLMNEVKALGVAMEDVLKKVEEHICKQVEATSDEPKRFNLTETGIRHNNATPRRFIAIAKTEFQTGLMYAARAVAQPEFF